MQRIKPRTLSGFMELLPDKQAQMDAVLGVLRQTYELYGFTGIDTPAIESAEVLLAKGGGETEKQIYRFTKGDSDLALRFDLTVPLAKYVAMNAGQLAFPFRRYQIAKVYRGERAQRGRFREFYQADIDVIGDGTLDIASDAEMPAVICDALRRLGLERFCIRINNRKVLNGLFALLDVTDPVAVMGAVDKLEKIGPEKVAGILTDLGMTADKVDLTIARGLDYYTGTVYETQLLDYPEVGSVCSGGRYDDLAGYYTDRKLPGVGLSIGVTRLFYILQEQGLLNDALPTAPCDALVIPLGEELDYAVRCAAALRNAGVRTQVYTEKKKAKAKFAYADKLRIPYAAVVGEDEAANGTVGLKDLRTGEQSTVSVDRAAEIIQESLHTPVTPVKEK